jgi:hypothetical protein
MCIKNIFSFSSNSWENYFFLFCFVVFNFSWFLKTCRTTFIRYLYYVYFEVKQKYRVHIWNFFNFDSFAKRFNLDSELIVKTWHRRTQTAAAHKIVSLWIFPDCRRCRNLNSTWVVLFCSHFQCFYMSIWCCFS